MIGKDTVETIRHTIAPHAAPVLSLYLDVNPANPDNVRKAHVRRAKDALKELDLPKAYAEDIVQRLGQEHVIARGRTLVVFAGEDPDELFESFYFQTDLPLLDLTDGALANWGAPYVAPILFALDEHQRYALAYLSQDDWRYFEVFLGEIEELRGGERVDTSDDWRHYSQARRSPGTAGPVQGGNNRDRFQDRQEDWMLRHYREAATELEQAVKDAGIERIVLIGQDGTVRDFEAQLSKALQDKVVARTSAPADTNASANEWLVGVAPELERVERENEDALLSQVREQGLWGYEKTLAALQEGRLSALLVPWGLDATVYRCEQSGLIASTVAEAEKICVGEKHHQLPFKELLPDLVTSFGLKLEFLTGEPGERLKDEFGGLAGVTRW